MRLLIMLIISILLLSCGDEPCSRWKREVIALEDCAEDPNCVYTYSEAVYKAKLLRWISEDNCTYP